MAFEFRRTIGGVGRKLELVKLANSQTVEVGDAIETYTTGLGVLATASEAILGIVVALCDASGLPIGTSDPVAGTASGVDTKSVATGTAGVSYALVDTSKQTVYSVKVSGTLGTTGTSSDLRGARFSVDSGNTEYGQILETTATRTIGTVGPIYSHGKDPNDATRLMVSIALSELDSDQE